MPFRMNARVEVCGNVEGVQDCYHEAKVIAVLPNNQYRVKYKNLLNKNRSGRLREIIMEDRLRPQPSKILINQFRIGNTVDVKHKDGWWRGVVVAYNDGIYGVELELYDDDVWSYGWNQMRIHQDFEFPNIWSYGPV